MKPTIGLIPLWDDEKESLWMLPGYMDGIREAGGIPIMLPLSTDVEEIEQLMTMVDGVLFTGGHDVSPSVYGEKALPGMVVSFQKRDEMESIVLDICLREHKAVLGICRGIQFINAAMGGKLYQDLPTEHPSDTEHHQTPPYDVPIHKVIVNKETPLGTILFGDNTAEHELMVNSYHHQAVKELAPGLEIMAESEDGLIEAVYKPDETFFWAFQWHPEFSYMTDESSRKIFEAFVEAMRNL